MTNIYHNFFYDDENAYCRKNYGPAVWYQDGVFYSYTTAIGRIYHMKDGNRALVYSATGFSSTTRKHIHDLWAACPFYKNISVPAKYEGHLTSEEILSKIEAVLSAERNFNRKEQREEFLNAFKALESLNELKGFKGIPAMIRKYQGIANQLNDKAAYRALSAKIVEKRKKAEARAAVKRAKILKQYSKLNISDQARAAYDYNSPLDSEAKAALRNALNPNRDLSFVWVDGDFIKTSQQIRVPATEAARLLTLWKAGKLKHGMTIDRYTVLNVGDDIVKIGCHNIPVENLKALNI